MMSKPNPFLNSPRISESPPKSNRFNKQFDETDKANDIQPSVSNRWSNIQMMNMVIKIMKAEILSNVLVETVMENRVVDLKAMLKDMGRWSFLKILKKISTQLENIK